MELLSPAGNFEKLRAAVRYGADAVYFGGEAFGLRVHAGKFSIDEMAEAVKYLHERGKRGYLTVNIYAKDSELSLLEEYLKKAAATGVDAFIISDPGVFRIARKAAPGTDIYISTQANTTNSSAVNFWADLGVKRVIMARELPRAELAQVIKKARCDVEIFAHGAICISYSGRCAISAYMTGRDANRGECTQPCRWNYTVTEATRPLQPMAVEEDKNGTYLYNAKDLCLISRVGELHEMGVSSLKIEGRMKSIMYVAVVTAVYRKAIDEALKNPGAFIVKPEWMDHLSSVSNRHYTEGFYAGVPDKEAMNYDTSAYVRTSDFLGTVESVDGNFVNVLCKGKFKTGEALSFFTPELEEIPINTAQIISVKGLPLEHTRSGETVTLDAGRAIPEGAILRRLSGESCTEPQ